MSNQASAQVSAGNLGSLAHVDEAPTDGNVMQRVTFMVPFTINPDGQELISAQDIRRVDNRGWSPSDYETWRACDGYFFVEVTVLQGQPPPFIPELTEATERHYCGTFVRTGVQVPSVQLHDERIIPIHPSSHWVHENAAPALEEFRNRMTRAL